MSGTAVYNKENSHNLKSYIKILLSLFTHVLVVDTSAKLALFICQKRADTIMCNCYIQEYFLS